MPRPTLLKAAATLAVAAFLTACPEPAPKDPPPAAPAASAGEPKAAQEGRPAPDPVKTPEVEITEDNAEAELEKLEAELEAELKELEEN